MYSVPAVCRPLLGAKASVVSMADGPGSRKTYKIAGGGSAGGGDGQEK